MPDISKHFRNRTYDSGNHVTIQLNMTFASPVDIQVELDAVRLGLCDKDIGELKGNMTEINLGEVEGSQRPRKHAFKHRFGDFFHHLAACNIDMWP